MYSFFQSFSLQKVDPRNVSEGEGSFAEALNFFTVFLDPVLAKQMAIKDRITAYDVLFERFDRSLKNKLIERVEYNIKNTSISLELRGEVFLMNQELSSCYVADQLACSDPSSVVGATTSLARERIDVIGLVGEEIASYMVDLDSLINHPGVEEKDFLDFIFFHLMIFHVDKTTRLFSNEQVNSFVATKMGECMGFVEDSWKYFSRVKSSRGFYQLEKRSSPSSVVNANNTDRHDHKI